VWVGSVQESASGRRAPLATLARARCGRSLLWSGEKQVHHVRDEDGVVPCGEGAVEEVSVQDLDAPCERVGVGQSLTCEGGSPG
jgi:hypothetical protein